MSSTTFVDGVTTILSSWLNDVNSSTYATGGPGIKTANFTIIEAGGKLVFQYQGTTIASLNNSGIFTAVSNIVGGGTP